MRRPNRRQPQPESLPLSDDKQARCYKCGHDWPASAFWRDRSRANGLTALCKNHLSEKMHAYWTGENGYYRRNRQRLIEAVQRRRQEAKLNHAPESED